MKNNTNNNDNANNNNDDANSNNGTCVIPVSRIMRHADDDDDYNTNNNDNTNKIHYYTCVGVFVRNIQRIFLKMAFFVMRVFFKIIENCWDLQLITYNL